MVRRTKEDAQETREKILNAAVDVFYTNGVMQSRLEDIAKAAGVTRGAVYWHFKNKLDLFTALHDRLHTSVMEQLIEPEDTNSHNPIGHLKKFAIGFLENLAHSENNRKIFSIFTIKCDYSGSLSSFLFEQDNKKAEGLKITTALFAKAIQKGDVAEHHDPFLLARIFCCYLIGITSEFLRSPSLFQLEKEIQPMIEIFFVGLR